MNSQLQQLQKLLETLAEENADAKKRAKRDAFGLFYACHIMASNEQPLYCSLGEVKTVKAIKEIQEAAKVLVKHLYGTRLPYRSVRQALPSKLRTLWDLGEAAHEIVGDADYALYRIANKKTTARFKGKSRPNRSTAIIELEQSLCEIFEQYTGKPATARTMPEKNKDGRRIPAKRYGPYLDFVTEVFKILRIKAKAGSTTDAGHQRRKQGAAPSASN